ncbi:MAG TPA: helix-turn-helix domain-containing protein [Roseomonas sp.]|nr:helix-turn-helix domain-containing protein [Roseomonas sp.]
MPTDPWKGWFGDAAFEEEDGPAARFRQRAGPAPDPARLLLSLAAAEDALSRLDALTGAASEPVRAGLAARLAFAEAAGWLMEEGVLVHSRDLALRASHITGSYTAATALGRLRRELPETWRAVEILPEEIPAEHLVEQALALARLLQRLATLRSLDPLDNAASLASSLRSLGPSAWPAALCAAEVQPPDFTTWRREWLATGQEQPTLLAAAEASALWLRQASEGDIAVPQLSQALFLAALLVKRRGRLRHVALPFWSARPAGAFRLRRPGEDPAGWPLRMLERIRAAALRGLDELDRLQAAAEGMARLAKQGRRSSSLGAVSDLALRRPVLTAGALAAKLGLTHQGALLLLDRLAGEGLLREITGRASFRAFAV